MDRIQALNASVFRHLTRDDIPAVFWHYTSQVGAMGIVQSNTIWATDIRFLNDEQEFAYTVDLAHDVLRAAPRRPVASLIEQTWQSMLAFIAERPFFVASFCREGDVLSQWRAYSGGSRGISLGFDSVELMRAAPPGVSFTTRCVYDVDLQRRILIDHLNDLEAAIEPDHGQPGVSIADAAAKFFQTLHMVATSFKHPGFAEEHEYRIAFNASHQATNVATVHRSGRVGITPYVQLPLSTTSDRSSLRQVIVGPTPHAAVAIEGAKSWLRTFGVAAAIANSRIPHRDW